MGFHIIEEMVVGVVRGRTIAQSFPAIAGGSLQEILSVGAIVFVALIPFCIKRNRQSDRQMRTVVSPPKPVESGFILSNRCRKSEDLWMRMYVVKDALITGEWNPPAAKIRILALSHTFLSVFCTTNLKIFPDFQALTQKCPS